MKSQINFCAEKEVIDEPILSAETLLEFAVLCALLFAVIYGSLAWTVSYQKSKIAKIEIENAQSQSKLTELKLKYEKISNSAALDALLAELERRKVRKLQTLMILHRKGLNQSIKFSSVLLGLARQNVEGAWVTEFSIGLGGEYLNINGATVHPQLVPKFISSLSNEEAFRDKSFDKLEIIQDKDSNINFYLKAEKGGATDE